MTWLAQVSVGGLACVILAACGGPISNNLIDARTYLLRAQFGAFDTEGHLEDRLAAEAEATCPKGYRVLRAYPNNEGGFGGLTWEIRCR